MILNVFQNCTSRIVSKVLCQFSPQTLLLRQPTAPPNKSNVTAHILNDIQLKSRYILNPTWGFCFYAPISGEI